MATPASRLRFLIDENVQRSVTRWLDARGHEVHESRDVAGSQARDAVLDWLASTEGLTIVTYDTDFRFAVRRMAPQGTQKKMRAHASILWLGIPEPRALERIIQCMEIVEHQYAYARDVGVRVERCEVQAERVVTRLLVPPRGQQSSSTRNEER